MRRAEDLSLLCLSPASNPHLYSELVPEGTFQKQQACPAQTTQRHGSLMQFHFCHGQPLPETPPVSAVTREGPAWQVRAAGQGAASSTDPGFLTCWPSEEQRRAERSTSTTGVGQGPTLGGPFRSRRPLLRSFHGLLSQLSDRSPLPWAGAGPGTPVTMAPVIAPAQEPLWGNRPGGPGFQILSPHPNHGSVPHPCPNP